MTPTLFGLDWAFIATYFVAFTATFILAGVLSPFINQYILNKISRAIPATHVVMLDEAQFKRLIEEIRRTREVESLA